jgi:DNA mismatch endonuclease (patch repair protein)
MIQSQQPRRGQADESVGRRFAALATRDTGPEMALRRELFARGLRYRVHYTVAGLGRRRVDIAFTRKRLAVMVDGCFWHGCPEHLRLAGQNAEWWAWKVAVNRDRDEDTDRRLEALGWSVVRVWEHEAAVEAADRIHQLLGSKA